MTIAEMHVAFRQYAQQMGMQNVRAILPEQIDLLLNQSITDTVNQLIRENIGITNDRVITDNSKIGQVNAFRTLYQIVEKDMTFDTTIDASHNFEYKPDKYALRGLIKHYMLDNTVDPLFGDYMFLVDVSINYKSSPVDGNDAGFITNWYPVRIIDSAYLSDTLNDFILKPRFRSPVACIYQKNTIEIYIEKFKGVEDTGEPNFEAGGRTLTPNQIRIDLIKTPAKVRYYGDISMDSDGVDCDLPENMHGDIVKHAVDLYRVALNGSLQAQQEAEQQQQRENMRNNYRNEYNQNQ